MVVTLGGVTLENTESKPTFSVDIVRTKIAASSRTSNLNKGLKNRKWSLTGWVNGETDLDIIEALVGTSGLAYVDKFGDSFTVSITMWAPSIKNHIHYSYSMTIEEDD